MFIDKIKIQVTAGDGGNGAISFHREKYVSAGGPDGGDGGRGGNIVFRIDEGANTLLAFRYKRKFISENGGNGMPGKKHGKNGEDTIVLVPEGTLIKDADSGKIIKDMTGCGDFVVCKGGRGGWGNRHFATPTRQIPRFAKNGTKGESKELELELKMIADVGIIGFPSVGKSSLLSKISSAKPKIAAYHFTTLTPNLGVVKTGDSRGFVAADIPGLIEGASEGMGLGLAFLRHIDRCRLLVHVVDIASTEGRDPIDDIKKINYELKRYSPELATRPQIIVANKYDVLDPDSEYIHDFEDFVKELGCELVYISAVSGYNLDVLVKKIDNTLKDLDPILVYEPEYSAEDEFIDNTDRKTTVRQENRTFYVEGDWLYNFMGQINFSDNESLGYFQRILIKSGVIDLLEEKGAVDGDTVNIYDFEFDFIK